MSREKMRTCKCKMTGRCVGSASVSHKDNVSEAVPQIRDLSVKPQNQSYIVITANNAPALRTSLSLTLKSSTNLVGTCKLKKDLNHLLCMHKDQVWRSINLSNRTIAFLIKKNHFIHLLINRQIKW